MSWMLRDCVAFKRDGWHARKEAMGVVSIGYSGPSCLDGVPHKRDIAFSSQYALNAVCLENRLAMVGLTQ